MKSIDLLNTALRSSWMMTQPLIEDLRESPMVRSTTGGNHAMWTIGHLATSDAHMFDVMMQGNESSLAKWDGLFSSTTPPVDNATVYPSYDEVVAAHKQGQERILALVSTLDDAALDTACKDIPEGFENLFGTHGLVLLMVSSHTMHHRGQLADIRRSQSKEPIMA